MTSKGWQYIAPVQTDPNTYIPNRWGTPAQALKFAETYGYGLINVVKGNPALDGKNTLMEDASIFNSLSPSQQALYTNDEKSCGFILARDKPNSAGILSNSAVNNLLNNAIKGETTTKQYILAQKKWSLCMKAKGYSFTATFQAPAMFNTDVVEGISTPQLQEEEIRVATADALCSESTIWIADYYYETAAVDKVLSLLGNKVQ